MNDLDGRPMPTAVRCASARSSIRRAVLASLLASSLASPFSAYAAPSIVATSAGAEAEYSDGAGAPIVTYAEIMGVVGAGPSLTVYGDGRVVADYPPGWKRAGRHSLRLDRAEVDALLATIVDAGVVEFDAAAVRSAVDAADQQRRAAGRGGQLFEVSDPDRTVIEVRLDRYKSATAPEARGVAKRVAWNSLRREARQHPEISALAKLETARQALRAVMARDGFAKE